MTDSSRKTLDMNWLAKEVAVGRGLAPAMAHVAQQSRGANNGTSCGGKASCGAHATAGAAPVGASSRSLVQQSTSPAHVGLQGVSSLQSGAMARTVTSGGATPASHGLVPPGGAVPSDLLQAARDALEESGLVLAETDLFAAVSQAWDWARKMAPKVGRHSRGAQRE